jgi:hypothetical protein
MTQGWRRDYATELVGLFILAIVSIFQPRRRPSTQAISTCSTTHYAFASKPSSRETP